MQLTLRWWWEGLLGADWLLQLRQSGLGQLRLHMQLTTTGVNVVQMNNGLNVKCLEYLEKRAVIYHHYVYEKPGYAMSSFSSSKFQSISKISTSLVSFSSCCSLY